MQRLVAAMLVAYDAHVGLERAEGCVDNLLRKAPAGARRALGKTPFDQVQLG
jgi:hypothetical protein